MVLIFSHKEASQMLSVNTFFQTGNLILNIYIWNVNKLVKVNDKIIIYTDIILWGHCLWGLRLTVLLLPSALL